MSRTRADQVREREISKLALDWLINLRGVDVHRRNVGAMRREYKGRSRVIGFGEPGACDFWYVHSSGIHVDLEIKRPGEWPRKNQIVWMLRVNAAGGIAFWIEGLETLKRVHDRIGFGHKISMYANGAFDLVDDDREARVDAIAGLLKLWTQGEIPKGQRKAVGRILGRLVPSQGEAK
jgi:hypothetical protein